MYEVINPPGASIAAQNDHFRALIPAPTRYGRFLITPGLNELADAGARGGAPGALDRALFDQIRSHADWDRGDDPYGEHDFGAFTYAGMKCLWKIDYFENAHCQYGALPAEGPVFRVMTVMLAEEY